MDLDVPSLIAAQLLTMLAMAVAVPCLMGGSVSVPARRGQMAMVGQCLGWALSLWPGEALLATLSLSLLAASLALLWEAVTGWLNRSRRLQVPVWALAGAVPLGFLALQHDGALRTTWANAGMAALLVVLCMALLQPASRTSRRWRFTMVAALLACACGTAWRGIEAALDPQGYGGFLSAHPSNVVANLLTLQCFVLVTLSSLVAWRDEAEQSLQSWASTDALTGLMNRRAFTADLQPVLEHAGRAGRGALLLLDLDHFKAINDTHGHAVGDRALALAARCIEGQLRRGDLACRWGGEEFCLYLVDGDERAVRELDSRLRSALTAQSIAALGWAVGYSAGSALFGPGGQVSPSAADLRAHTGAQRLEALAHAADMALYAAKHAGRGRLVLARDAQAA